MWLLPSRRRPHNLARFFENAQAMEISTPGIIIIQREDFKDNQAAYEALPLPAGWSIIKTDADRQGSKLREIQDQYWNAEWIALIGDDQIPMTPKWDRMLLDEIKGWNIVSCNDGWTFHKRNGRIAGTIMMSGDLMRALGYIFIPGTEHIKIDDAYEKLGRATGCWQIRQDILIDHPHVVNKRAPADDTYAQAYESGTRDDVIYQRWEREGFGPDVEKIKALMRSHGVEPHEHDVPIFIGPNTTVPEFNGQI